MRRIGDFIDVQSGYAFDSKLFNDRENGTPIIRIRDVKRGHTKTFTTEPFNESYLVKKGDILVGMDGEFNLERWKSDFALLNQRVCKITVDNHHIHKDYLYYLLPKELKRIEDATPYVTVKHISAKQIRNISIPLPPLPIQKKIAEVLDKADAIRQRNSEILEKYDQLAESLFLEMFGDPVRNEKGWDKMTMNTVSKKITDGTHHSPETFSSGFPYVTAKHVKHCKLNFESNPTYISEEDHDSIYKRCDPKFGDILYIKDGATTGMACINTFNSPISILSSLALIRPNNDLINNLYLLHYLNHSKVKEFMLSKYMAGAAIKRFTLKKINAFRVVVPPLDLQMDFAKRIEVIENQKNILLREGTFSENLFQSLLQKAFKGELFPEEVLTP